MPDGFDVSSLVDALADGWGVEVATADYAAVGGGSYHWIVHDVDGTDRFVTVDDLDQKPWLADTRDTVFAGLRRAFDTAGALHDLGLDFVVAPIRTVRARPYVGSGRVTRSRCSRSWMGAQARSGTMTPPRVPTSSPCSPTSIERHPR